MFDSLFGGRRPLRSLISETEEIRDVKRLSKNTDVELTELRQRMDRLSRANTAMWSLLKHATGLKDEQLQKEIQRLEIEEATERESTGGRTATSAARVCKDCKRTVSRLHTICIYCGGVDLIEPAGASPIG